MSRPLKGSLNFIWWEKDELGKGATATVYKCREKKTGDLYAVKVFSSRHRERLHYGESQQQEREFQLLQKLRHENIVRMLSIEEESQTSERPPSRVIVMEYCNGGSLYSILDQPTNAYGLEEEEFLLFLLHITEGLRYLREQKVVHRDIKPGNIMKLITAEGRSIYKLTDFGAAKLLEEHDQDRFTSLYGTEEYLHPDLYDRAVMRNGFGSSQSFSSSVDLWSVGVTIYHVATGSLPFRPFGGRRNRNDMQKILKNKEYGVISGVQERERAEIEYSKSLPNTCALSEGLKLLIVPLIAGLLEVNLHQCTNFDRYFQVVNDICNKVILDVFDTSKCKMIKVYCDPSDNLRKMKELIEKQCKYVPKDQLLLYENGLVEDLMGEHGKSDRFPSTTDSNPVFLYHCVDPVGSSEDHPAKPFVPKFPRFGSAYDLEKDYQLAKACTGVMMYICRKVNLMLTLQCALDKAVKAYEYLTQSSGDKVCDELPIEIKRHYLIRMVILLRDNIMMVVCTADEVRMRFQFMKNISSLPSIRDSSPSLLQRMPELQGKFEEITMYMSDLRKYGEDYKEKISDKRELSHKWRRRSGCDKDKDMCYEKASSMTQSVENCKSEFDRERKMKTLPYNEEQIHKFEKNKMSENCTSALSLLEDHCWDGTKKTFQLFRQWFTMAFRIQAKILKLKTKMEKLQITQGELSRDLKESDFELLRLVDKVSNTPMTSVTSTPSYPVTAGMSGLSLSSEDTGYELPLGDVENYSEDQKELFRDLRGMSSDMKQLSQIASDNSRHTDDISALCGSFVSR